MTHSHQALAISFALLTGFAMSACSSPSEKAVENIADNMEDQADAVTDMAENKADAIEANAAASVDSAENRADAVRDAAEMKANAIENAADKAREQK